VKQVDVVGHTRGLKIRFEFVQYRGFRYFKKKWTRAASLRCSLGYFLFEVLKAILIERKTRKGLSIAKIKKGEKMTVESFVFSQVLKNKMPIDFVKAISEIKG